MKKLFVFLSALTVLLLCFSVKCGAESVSLFENEVDQIENSVDEDTSDGLDSLGISGVEDILSGGIDNNAVWNYLFGQLTAFSSGPLSALIMMTAALLFASIAESYTYSLRYTDTKDVMGVAVSLFMISVIVSPVTDIVASTVRAVQGASTVMTVYLPVMAGMMAFSGHAIASGGYYAAVVTVAQLLSRLASSVLSPLLNIFLSLSVSAGICSQIKLGGLIETVSKGFKYGITFAMSVFIAVLGLNGVLTGAADGVANKAAKFTLSSFIPLIGSSVAEAYGAIQNSVNVLRSGIGVFVILAVFIAFAPLLIKTVLWSFTLTAAKSLGEALSVSSAASILNAMAQFISALRVLLIAVMTVFMISSSIMLRMGGQS